jgi:hypothetical protein
LRSNHLLIQAAPWQFAEHGVCRRAVRFVVPQIATTGTIVKSQEQLRTIGVIGPAHFGPGIEEWTMLGTILLVILVLLLLGALPNWGYSSNWGYGPSGGLGLVIVIILILVLMGRI